MASVEEQLVEIEQNFVESLMARIREAASEAYERGRLDERRAASPEEWHDADDEWTEAIKSEHPTRTGNHERYAKAMRMVSRRRSKGALVELVNMLLAVRDEAKADCTRQRIAAACARMYLGSHASAPAHRAHAARLAGALVDAGHLSGEDRARMEWAR